MKPNILNPKTNTLDSLWFIGSFESDQIGFDVDDDASPLTDEQKFDRVMSKPFKLDLLPKEQIASVACGGMHSLALTASGTVYAWGINDCGELGRSGSSSSFIEKVMLPGAVAQISCGESHSLALIDNDRKDVYYWGQFRNVRFMQIDSDQIWPSAFAPTHIEPSSFDSCRPFKLSSGLNHALILAADRNFKFHVFGIGDDSIGKLANGVTHKFDRCRAVKLNLIDPIDVWAIGSSSYYQKVASRMKLYGWGYNFDYTLGLGHNKSPVMKPTCIEFFTGQRIIDITGGEYFSIFLNSKHSVFACGKNESGQTGTGLQDTLNLEEVKKLKLPKNIVRIGAGDHTAFALSSTGEAYAWGDGSNYVLGNQSEENAFSPLKIDLNLLGAELIVDVRPIQLAFGGQHSLIVTRPESGFLPPSRKRKSSRSSSRSQRRRKRPSQAQ